jgi:hypothetical protein
MALARKCDGIPRQNISVLGSLIDEQKEKVWGAKYCSTKTKKVRGVRRVFLYTNGTFSHTRSAVLHPEALTPAPSHASAHTRSCPKPGLNYLQTSLHPRCPRPKHLPRPKIRW